MVLSFSHHLPASYFYRSSYYADTTNLHNPRNRVTVIVMKIPRCTVHI